MTCKHETFTSSVDIHRKTDIHGTVLEYWMHARVECQQCGMPFTFRPVARTSAGNREIQLEITPDYVPFKIASLIS